MKIHSKLNKESFEEKKAAKEKIDDKSKLSETLGVPSPPRRVISAVNIRENNEDYINTSNLEEDGFNVTQSKQ